MYLMNRQALMQQTNKVNNQILLQINSRIKTKQHTGETTRDEDTVSMNSFSDEGDVNHPLDVSNSKSSSHFECDVGKLLNLHVDLQQLSRDEKYQIHTTEPNRDPSAYPNIRLYPSSSKRQFQPSWMKQFPWLHYSKSTDGAFCRACVLFAPVLLVVKILASL